MGKHSKKQFIDKKKAVHFVVGHRSQRDPLIADENASQRVLIEMENPHKRQGGTTKEDLIADGFDAEYFYHDDEVYEEYERAQGRGSMQHVGNDGELYADLQPKMLSKAEYDNYAFPDDGYDYSQHLLPMAGAEFVSAEAQEALGSSANEGSLFGSSLAQEADVGMLNLAAPTGFDPTLDTDVMGVLDGLVDDEEVDELEDDFVALAGGEGKPEKKGMSLDEYEKMVGYENLDYYDSDGFEEFSSGDEFEAGMGGGRQFAMEERSYASTRTHKHDGGFAEEHFEQVMNKAYGEEDIGGFEDTDPRLENKGGLSLEAVEHLFDEFDEEEAKKRQGVQAVYKKLEEEDAAEEAAAKAAAGDADESDSDSDSEDEPPMLVPVPGSEKAKEVAMAKAQEEAKKDNGKEDGDGREEEGEDEGEDEYEWIRVKDRDAQWDVVSYASQLTNTENHPGLIKDVRPAKKQIKLNKHGLPMGVLEARRAAKSDVANNDEEAEEEEEEEEEDEYDDDDDDYSVASVNMGEKRDKHESAEEKRMRKKAVKAARKARRKEKKTLKQAFKKEEMKQRKQRVGNASTTRPGVSAVRF